MKKLLAGLCAMLATVSFATTLFWQGGASDSALDSANYTLDEEGTTPSGRLPGAGDVIWLPEGSTFPVDNDSVVMVGSVANVHPFRNATMIVDVSTNAVFGAAFSNYSRSAREGLLVKRGDGELRLSSLNSQYTETGSYKRYHHYENNITVEGGSVVMLQSGFDVSYVWFIGKVTVGDGCAFELPGSTAIVYVEGLCGAGTVRHETGSQGVLYVRGNTTEDLSGLLTGNIKLNVAGSIRLTNVANDFTSNGITLSGGTLGARLFGNTGTDPSSLGANGTRQTINNGSTFLCLATAEDGVQSSNRMAYDYAQDTLPVSFDGGAYGGWTHSGSLTAMRSRMKHLILTGSNTEECVWSAPISMGSGYTGYYYLTKRGSGVWRMSATSAANRKALVGIEVAEGTLRFNTLSEADTSCSIGVGNANAYGYGYCGPVSSAPATVDYTIRLGSPADLTKEGVLEFTGTGAGLCTTRPIAVVGRGRIKNSAANAAGTTFYSLRWENFCSVVPPEDASLVPALSTLTFDGSKGNGWATNITEEAGAAPLCIAKEGTGTWNLGGTLGFTGGIDVREGTLAVGAALSASQPYLRVDHGAALDLTGGAATVTGFAIDAAKGIGTISGVAFASGGTLSITNVAALPATVPCDSLSGCAGIANLSGWTLVVNGVESTKCSISATAGAIRITDQAGLVIFVK